MWCFCIMYISTLMKVKSAITLVVVKTVNHSKHLLTKQLQNNYSYIAKATELLTSFMPK